MLAVKKLAEMQKASEGRGSLRKKPPPAQEVMTIESPPHDSAECMSPKMSSFQDGELSNELQTAMNRGGEVQEGAEVRPGGGQLSQRTRSMHENSLGKSRDGDEGGGPPRKEARTARQGSHTQGMQRSGVPPPLGKPRQSFPSGGGASYTPPQTPTKTKPSSPQTIGPPQGSAKVKPSPQLLAQTERPMSPRSLPQSPTHRGYTHVTPQPVETVEAPPAQQPAVSVPLLCLPPEGYESEEDHGLPKKRAHSLSRYATLDHERERGELMVPDTTKYATMQARVSRSNSARSQADKNVNRSQSFALRPKKKGPPPPPPKRSSSTISTTNLEDDARDGGGGDLLAVNYHERRRASDLGGMVDTGSAGSVKSIAAMLEMSSIGGGSKALAIQRSLCGSGCYLQVMLHCGCLVSNR